MMEKAPILTVAVTSRTLFDLRDEHEFFRQNPTEAYEALQRERLNVRPAPGPAFSLVKKILALNTDPMAPLTEVVLVSRNDPFSGLRIMRAMEHYGLPITRSIWTRGEDPFPYMDALDAQLFLSAEPSDVKAALHAGFAAATFLGAGNDQGSGQLRLAFDFDCVVAGDESQRVFDEAPADRKVQTFHHHESERREIPMPPGPLRPFLERLAKIQTVRPGAIVTGLFTARMAPAHERPLTSLIQWGIHMDSVFFLGGKPKGPFLSAWKADFFLDDSRTHAEGAARAGVPAGLVQ